LPPNIKRGHHVLDLVLAAVKKGGRVHRVREKGGPVSSIIRDGTLFPATGLKRNGFVLEKKFAGRGARHRGENPWETGEQGVSHSGKGDKRAPLRSRTPLRKKVVYYPSSNPKKGGGGEISSAIEITEERRY